MFKLIRLIASRLQSQINVIMAISAYERERKSADSALGAWEVLVQPLQMLFFLLMIRVGLRLLIRGSNFFAPEVGAVGADLYFDPLTFLATGLTLVFLFRQSALKSINGLKLKAPLFYARIKPLDVLLASALNDVRALASLTTFVLILSWCFTWSYQFDRPGLAISAYLLTVIMAVGFGVCILFVGICIEATACD